MVEGLSTPRAIAQVECYRAAILFARTEGIVVAPVFASPTDAKSYIAGMDFFIGARMHAAIAAFSSGVPVVPMAYSRKFQGVFGTLGYPHVANCKADSAEEIIDRVMSGYANRASLADEVATAMQAVNARLDAYRDMAGVEMAAALAR